MPTPCSSTVAKAFRVLHLFRDHQSVTVTTCQESLGIPRATAHRLLVSLREAGAVEQTSDGHYQLSVGMFELGAVAPARRRLSDRCGGEVEALAERTGFRVHLAVLRESHVLYLEAAHGRQAREQGFRTRAGYRGPLHATALGKVLLAFAPQELQSQVLEGELLRYTPYTVSDPSLLRQDLIAVHKNGYSFTAEEYVLGISSLAVPLVDGHGEVQAALSIVGAAQAMTRRQEELRAEARATAARIARGDSATFRRRSRGQDALVVSR